MMRHELGHYIAFPHEHQKWNRNNYIQLINEQNATNSQFVIIPEMFPLVYRQKKLNMFPYYR